MQWCEASRGDISLVSWPASHLQCERCSDVTAKETTKSDNIEDSNT